ncbi:Hemerythrin HHE cation binding domain-containing protein [Nitrosospira multiformis]|uniref:Hemerythrin HHE cation binding domain-containing protein n=1 Tax=Nitrosospira multiformis TaxID=1231 RepID=A0A1I0CXH2_9PROT|nr:hemerythrin domain-containing protein [Nitrosospira multiformis]SET24467.1 Hemerythrin HHE cation binding domain-containing protein [Nitrosospira multiformis]
MSRIGALLSLSREHHTSLVVARDARRAASTGDPAVLSAAIRDIESHWATLLVRHFEVEERLLETVGSAFAAEVAARIRAEHEELRRLACNTCELTPIDRLRRFGELLGSHVRYEERIAFPQLQSHSCITKADI